MVGLANRARCLLVIACLLGASCSSSPEEDLASPTTGGGVTDTTEGDDSFDLVFLEPADEVGVDPFLEGVEVADAPQDQVLEDGAGAASAGQDGVVTLVGGTSRLYAASQRRDACDVEELITGLTGQPSKAEAWAEVQGIDADELPAFIRSLTPVLVTGDFVVTNHGFRAGSFVPKLSVLQAGTAVLVDARGVPRMRCLCGNPLLEPQEAENVRFVGEEWDGFSEEALARVSPADSELTELVVLDVDSGADLELAIGEADAAEQEPTVTGEWTAEVVFDEYAPSRLLPTVEQTTPQVWQISQWDAACESACSLKVEGYVNRVQRRGTDSPPLAELELFADGDRQWTSQWSGPIAGNLDDRGFAELADEFYFDLNIVWVLSWDPGAETVSLDRTIERVPIDASDTRVLTEHVSWRAERNPGDA